MRKKRSEETAVSGTERNNVENEGGNARKISGTVKTDVSKTKDEEREFARQKVEEKEHKEIRSKKRKRLWRRQEVWKGEDFEKHARRKEKLEKLRKNKNCKRIFQQIGQKGQVEERVVPSLDTLEVWKAEDFEKEARPKEKLWKKKNFEQSFQNSLGKKGKFKKE